MFLLHNSIDNYKFTQYTTKKYLASSLTNTGKVFGGKRVKQGVCMSTSTVVRAECERITQINRHNTEYYIVAPREICI